MNRFRPFQRTLVFLALSLLVPVGLLHAGTLLVPQIPANPSFQLTIDHLPPNGGTIRISDVNSIVVKDIVFLPGETFKYWNRTNTLGQVVPVGIYTYEIITQ